eukprot:scaffold2420_cov259-Pinguiococcus_pyrenoidosus.AAC.17
MLTGTWTSRSDLGNTWIASSATTGDVIFMNSTCFGDQLLEGLARQAEGTAAPSWFEAVTSGMVLLMDAHHEHAPFRVEAGLVCNNHDQEAPIEKVRDPRRLENGRNVGHSNRLYPAAKGELMHSTAPPRQKHQTAETHPTACVAGVKEPCPAQRPWSAEGIP